MATLGRELAQEQNSRQELEERLRQSFEALMLQKLQSTALAEVSD